MKKLLILSLSVLLFNEILNAQQAQAQRPAAGNPPAAKGVQPKPETPRIDEKGGQKKAESSAAEIALDLRLFGGLAIPLDALSSTGANLGGGGEFSAELKLPFALGPLEVKAGVSAGFFGLGFPPDLGSLSASVSLVPIMAYGIIAYPIKPVGIIPFVGVGGGGTVVAYDITGGTSPLSANSFDGTLGFKVGLEYVLPPVPQLSLVLNLGYLIIFEVDPAGLANNGQLLAIELGASYRILGKR